ncbi:MAG: hypothetical protein H7332_16080 [Bdellovibrionales bacterium]|nr:hypothetical protein [Ramlibacter sp.]
MSALQGARNELQSDSYGRISIFLDQVADILRLEELAGVAPDYADSADEAEKAAAARPATVPTAEVARSAASHGRELRRLGFTIDEVVRNYGGMCQAITTLAMDLEADMKVAEFRTLNRCLDEAIAQAVVAYTSPERRQEPSDADKDASRLDTLAAMYHYADSAKAAVTALRTGRVGLEGATGAVLDNSLKSLSRLIDDAIKKVG